MSWGSLYVQLASMGLNRAADDARDYRDREYERQESGRRAARAAEDAYREARYKQLERDAAWSAFAASRPIGKVVNVSVIRVVPEAVVVEFDNVLAVVPASELDEPAPKSPLSAAPGTPSVGQSLQCIVIAIDESNKLAILGTKRAHDKRDAAVATAWTRATKSLRAGTHISAKVFNVLDVGVVVHLKSHVTGIVPLSELDEPAPSRAADVAKIGEILRCVVADIEPTKRMIVLTTQRAFDKRKRAFENAWSKVEELYAVGTRISPRIARIEDTALVVELGPHVKGFVPLADLDEPPPKKFGRRIKVGAPLDCVVIHLDVEKRLVVLAAHCALEKRAQATKKVWQQVAETLQPGTIVEARIVRVIDPGVIVDLGNGLTGYVPTSEVDDPAPVHPSERVVLGEMLDCIVLQVDPHRRLILLTTKRALDKRVASDV